MELWITLSILAALFQNVRFMLQKVLSKVTLTPTGATFARFVYSAPIAVLFAIIYGRTQGVSLDLGDPLYWMYSAVGGASQITATIFTVILLGRRNFAVGITLKKTEVLLTALVGFILLGDVLSLWGFIAIIVGITGVLVLSGSISTDGPWWKRLISPSAALGLSAGALFGVSGVAYRGASLLIDDPDPFVRASITLAVVTSMQLIGMAIWMAIRDAGEIRRVLGAWRTAGWIGLTSIAGSFCWFSAFTLQSAAYVKAIGQVELIFSIMASTLFFKEKITLREIAGIILIAISVLTLISFA